VGHHLLRLAALDNSGLYAEPIFYEDLDKIQRKYMDDGYIRVNIGRRRSRSWTRA